ncbi:MAG: acyl carrier protein [Eubacterium sp.]|nr:acyl carrier protein [Eubacterium sp.]
MEFDLLKRIIAEEMGLDTDEITMDTTFEEDLGADSLDVTSIIMALEEELDIEISDDDAVEIKTVGDAVDKIKAALGNED